MDPEASLDTGWLVDYRGLSVHGAIALAKSQERIFRVLRPGSVRTADHNQHRLNILVGEDGSLTGFEAG